MVEDGPFIEPRDRLAKSLQSVWKRSLYGRHSFASQDAFTEGPCSDALRTVN